MKLHLIKALAVSMAVAGFGMTTYAQASLNKEIQIINRTGESIMQFYASHVYDPDWHEDLLGPGVIAPGSRQFVDTDDGRYGCMFDFKTVMENDRVFIRHNVNVCALERYTFS